MRVGSYHTADSTEPWCGVPLDDGRIVNLAEAAPDAGMDLPTDTTALLERSAWIESVETVVDHGQGTETGVYRHDEVERTAPIPAPPKIVCVGLNYRDHAEEGGNPIPEEPVLFAKFPTAITGPGEPIRWDPSFTESVDYEAELVIVIGHRSKDVTVERAGEAVAGYLIGNDVSARDLQHGDGQWVRGKSLDTFAPIGPELVTKDEVADPHDLAIWTEVNGERVQDSTTANLIFGVEELVAFCSRAFTLEPGDLIFTGTPPGVGIYRDPPVLLDDGDTVTVGIEGLGELTNPCSHS